MARTRVRNENMIKKGEQPWNSKNILHKLSELQFNKGMCKSMFYKNHCQNHQRNIPFVTKGLCIIY